MTRWDAWLGGLADVLGPLLWQTPPKLGSTKFSDMLDTVRLAWRYRGLGTRTVGEATRLFAMSIGDLLGDWFESDEVKATIATQGVIGTWAGPDEPGTAYVMAHHSIGDVGDGTPRQLGRSPRAAWAPCPTPSADRPEELGRPRFDERRVDRILRPRRPGTGRGRSEAARSSGSVVVTAVHPQITFLQQIERGELPPTSSRHRATGRAEAAW